MDKTRWKAVILPRELYEQLKIISEVEGRTLSGQLRLVFNDWKTRNLSTKDLIFVNEKVAEKFDNSSQ